MDAQIRKYLESKGFELVNKSDEIYLFLKKIEGKFIEVSTFMDTEFRIVVGSSVSDFSIENTIKMDCKGAPITTDNISFAFQKVVFEMERNISLHYENLREMKDTFK